MVKKLVAGVGTLGIGEFSRKNNLPIYSKWNAMLRRCYNPKDVNYHRYGGSGITVCTDWLNFQNYCKWYLDNYVQGMTVDKDISQQNIYSPETCRFVSHQRNIEVGKAKHYTFLNPSGDKVNVYNLAKFCRENGLRESKMHLILKNSNYHHRNWRKA